MKHQTPEKFIRGSTNHSPVLNLIVARMGAERGFTKSYWSTSPEEKEVQSQMLHELAVQNMMNRIFHPTFAYSGGFRPRKGRK